MEKLDIKLKDGIVIENYDANNLKKLKGNRNVEQSRINKIKKSVGKIGWIKPQIIVNENFEIIDGQGRVEIAKEYNLPIDVRMVNGLTISDCMAMNVDQTNWTMKDFIASYAEQGNKSYSYVKKLIETYPQYSIQVISFAVSGVEWDSTKIKEGRVTCTKEQFEYAIDRLEWLSEYDEILTSEVGGVRRFQEALLYVKEVEGTDLNRVKTILQNYSFTNYAQAHTIKESLDIVTELYNNRLNTKNKIYFNHKYIENGGGGGNVGGLIRWYKKSEMGVEQA